MRIFWSAIFIIFGLILLGLNFSWWTLAMLAVLLPFWPLLFILLGIGLIAKPFRWGWVIVMPAILICFWLAYYLINNNSNLNKPRQNKTETTTTDFSADLPGNIKSAKITIKTGAVDLRISRGEKLINGSLESGFSAPRLEVNSTGDRANVTLSSLAQNRFWTGKNTLTVFVSDKIPIDLQIDAGASKITLNLEDINLSGLTLNAGASSIHANIGQIVNNSIINMNTGASSITLNLPRQLGATVNFKTGLTNKDLVGFVQKENNIYETDNIASAATKVNISVSAGASNFKITRS